MYLIEQKGRYRLYCYPLAGWAIAEMNGEIINRITINGPWQDVWTKYQELTR